MKRIILSALVCCLCLSSLAAPWDIPQKKFLSRYVWDKPFDDPYVTSYGAFIQGDQGYPTYKLNMQVYLNTNPPLKWLVTLQVPGVWHDIGAGEKQFDFVISTAQYSKSITIALNAGDVPATTQVWESYEGPF